MAAALWLGDLLSLVLAAAVFVHLPRAAWTHIVRIWHNFRPPDGLAMS